METRENDETIQLKRKVEDDVEADKPRKRANALPDSSAKNWVSVSFRGHRVRYRKCTFLKFPECTLSKMILGPELAGNVECGSYSPVIAQDFDEKGYVLVDLDFDVISPIITFMQYEHATGEQFIRFPSHVPRHTALSVCSFLGMEPYMYSFCKREFNKFTERESAFDFLESVISLLRAFFAMVLQLENVGHQSNPKALMICRFYNDALIEDFVNLTNMQFHQADRAPDAVNSTAKKASDWLFNHEHTLSNTDGDETYKACKEWMWNAVQSVVKKLRKIYSKNAVMFWTIYRTCYTFLNSKTTRQRLIDCSNKDLYYDVRTVRIYVDVAVLEHHKNTYEYKELGAPKNHVYLFQKKVNIPSEEFDSGLKFLTENNCGVWAVTNMSNEQILVVYDGILKPISDLEDCIA